jgi:hypothetical protein
LAAIAAYFPDIGRRVNGIEFGDGFGEFVFCEVDYGDVFDTILQLDVRLLRDRSLRRPLDWVQLSNTLLYAFAILGLQTHLSGENSGIEEAGSLFDGS